MTQIEGITLKGFFGAILAWLRTKSATTYPLDLWSVRFVGNAIVTSDGQGTELELSLQDLRRVVVATDDSGPWGADYVFLLFSSHPDPVALFPLEAEGCDLFVAWMSTQPGFQDRELAKAAGSTQVARFEVLVVDPDVKPTTPSSAGA